MQSPINIGKVILAGAGPGDPELITAKAIRYLRLADVVIVDRLVSHEIIEEYVKADATVIYAGKQSGKGYSTRQTTINQLLVEHAMNGKLVVRLKGGDVSIFSNILDELQALTEHDIPYEVIPGVTAALGAAAYSGIPLTARDHSVAVRFLTYYDPEILSDAYWSELANTNDTLVFYMSAESLPKAIENLKRHHVDHSKQIALIEQATTSKQRVRVFSFENFPPERLEFLSPGLVVIGKVVSLHEKFKWRQNYEGDEYYFQPLTKAMSVIRTGNQVNAS